MNSTNSIALVKRVLLNTGYEAKNIERNYEFDVSGRKVVADLVAFSDHHKKDYLTSCIAVKFCRTDTELDDYSDLLKYTAAPIAILPRPEIVAIRPLHADKNIKPTLKQYQEIEEFFQKNRMSFLPSSLQAIKREGRQLSFFELDPNLYDFVFNISQQQLVTTFEDAIKAAFDFIDTNVASAREIVIKAAIKLLTAKILQDKKVISTRYSQENAAQLLSEASAKFPGYFDTADFKFVPKKVPDAILECLRGYNYKVITNEQLGYFYEHTFVNKDLRKDNGIYYTPQKIAQAMLKSLPIEEIPPEKRHVFDGTCGSGSLLTAAYHRLYELLPKTWDETKKHDYLINHITGIDQDIFSVEIAKKSLLLASLPSGDHWKIQCHNFFSTNSANTSFAPHIIVANPPFKETKTGLLKQKAAMFLDTYVRLLPENGLIGIVLPEPYLQNKSCRQSRETLHALLNILEMWQLPEGAFPEAQFATLVLIGKRKTLNNIGRFARVRRLLDKQNIVERTRSPIEFDLSYLTDGHVRLTGPNREINISPFDTLFERLRSLSTLREYYEVSNGVIIGKNGRQSLSRIKLPGTVKYLSGSRFMEPYVLRWNLQDRKQVESYIFYPDTIERPRLEAKDALLSRDKILVNSARGPSNPWRLYAAIDRIGVVPGPGFYFLSSRSKQSPEPEVITALINSPVINVLIDSYARKRWIVTDKVKDIPVPPLNKKQNMEIIEIVRAIEKNESQIGFATNSQSVGTTEKLIERLDDIIFRAYGITEYEKQSINNLLGQFRRPGLEDQLSDLSQYRRILKPTERVWKVSGKILEIRPEDNRMTLWLLGYEEKESVVKIEIPDTLPGWALENGINFEATIPFEQRHEKNISKLDFIDFRLLKNAYMSDDQIEAAMHAGHE